MSAFNTPLSGTYSGLRVVHAANYQFDKDGSVFFNTDQKFHQGLVQNGCFVYPFSINDRARMLSLFGTKTLGKGPACRALIKTCRNIRPDVLLLGHAQYVSRDILLAIRNEVPEIRIALWYIDPLWVLKHIQHLHARVDALDAVFATTAGELLQSLARPGCPAGFIPNPVEGSIERLRTFENPDPRYDVVFFGSDKRAPERRQMLQELVNRLPNVRMGLFGSLGHDFIFGHEKEQVLAQSRMALNLSRKSDVALYSSDRIAQLTGNGLATLTPTGSGIEELYSTDEVAYFEDVPHLIERLQELKKDDARTIRIAQAGWQRSHENYSAANIARFMLSLTLRDANWQSASWANHVFEQKTLLKAG